MMAATGFYSTMTGNNKSQFTCLTGKVERRIMFIFAAIDTARQPVEPVKINEGMIAQIGRNDHQAFKDFYEITSKPLFAYILSITRNPHDAEDVLQDTYLKIRAAAHLYEPRGKPMAWVFTIARNLSLMHLRKGKSIHQDSVENLEQQHWFTEVMDHDDRIVLEFLLNQLEEQERSIIILHAVSGYKHIEIARNLGLPLATVLSKYHRGLKKIKKTISQRKGGER